MRQGQGLEWQFTRDGYLKIRMVICYTCHRIFLIQFTANKLIMHDHMEGTIVRKTCHGDVEVDLYKIKGKYVTVSHRLMNDKDGKYIPWF